MKLIIIILILCGLIGGRICDENVEQESDLLPPPAVATYEEPIIENLQVPNEENVIINTTNRKCNKFCTSYCFFCFTVNYFVIMLRNFLR